jgi:hypothetical protein
LSHFGGDFVVRRLTGFRAGFRVFPVGFDPGHDLPDLAQEPDVLALNLLKDLTTTFRIMSLRNDTQHNDIELMVLSITAFSIMTLTHHIDTKHNDIHHNDTQHNDIQHNNIQHNDINHDDTQHNDIQHNRIQHYEFNCKTQHKKTQYSPPQNLTLSCSASFFTDMLGCHYPQSRYTDSRGAINCNLYNG